MLALGLNFQKGRIRLVALRRNNSTISFEQSRVIKIDPELPVTELMERYKSNFKALAEEFHPDLVAGRSIWESTSVDSAKFQIMPIAVLALVCGENNIDLASDAPQALRNAGPFGLSKGVKPIDAVEAEFGAHPPNWDDMQKNAALVAWRALREAS